MSGIVPAIPLAPGSQPASRLVDHFPDQAGGRPHRHRWGSEEVLSSSGGHRVERLVIKAGQSFPPHYHKRRSEHWTVVQGDAEVQLGDDIMIVSVDDSLYIPSGVVHGLRAGPDQAVKLVVVHYGETVSDADDLFEVV